MILQKGGGVVTASIMIHHRQRVFVVVVVDGGVVEEEELVGLFVSQHPIPIQSFRNKHSLAESRRLHSLTVPPPSRSGLVAVSPTWDTVSGRHQP
jgi:hypothetical protein